jgi:hypothetical protein
MMAQQACEYINGCPMFKYFCSVAKTVYADIYCRTNPDICERRKRRAAGKPVPDNLLPHGGKLWKDDDKPPDMWGQG